MPAEQQGQIDGKPGSYRLRWYEGGKRQTTKLRFQSKTDARKWFRQHVEPRLNGEPVTKELTLSEFVPVYLTRHGLDVRERTIKTLRERLAHAEKRFGDIPLRELEGMADEIAAWRAKQPSGVAYGRMAALRQTLSAAVRWGYMGKNPAVLAGKNRQPKQRDVRVYSMAELDAIAAELSPQYQPLPMFAAATGLRPEEWRALERRDIDRRDGVLNVRRTVSNGEVVELGKTSRSRRQVPLSPRALAALDALPPRLDTPRLFPSPEGALLHENNFADREWRPAIEAAGIAKPARVYDMRHTFATNAIAARIDLFELAKIMGTSTVMLERVYGSLLGGAMRSMADRLGAWETGAESAQREEEAL